MRRGAASTRAALIAGGILLAWCGVETILRLSFSPQAFDERYPSGPPGLSHVVGHPFLPFLGRPDLQFRRFMDETGGFIEVKNNGYGFRTHEFPREKGPRDFVVVCLGESTTWDYFAASNEVTWPALLERRLAATYPQRNVRVFNLGIEGGSIPYSLVVLSLIGIHLQPDLVIVYHGFNDYGPATARSYRWDYSHHYVDLDAKHLWHGLARTLPPALRWSYATRVAASTFDTLAGVNDRTAGQKDLGAMEEDPVAAARRILPDLDSIGAIARGHGAKVLYSTFQFRDGDCQQARAVNAALRSHFAEDGPSFVDQDALIPDGDPTLQPDPCHFSRMGSELLAANYYDHIVGHDLIAPTLP